MELDDYVIKKIASGKPVSIKITGVRTKDGYLQMNWLIDNKFIIEDMPSEVFEGEDCVPLGQGDGGSK